MADSFRQRYRSGGPNQAVASAALKIPEKPTFPIRITNYYNARCRCIAFRSVPGAEDRMPNGKGGEDAPTSSTGS
jgi:hypothetical protein